MALSFGGIGRFQELGQLEVRLRCGARIEDQDTLPGRDGLGRLAEGGVGLGEGFLRRDEEGIQRGGSMGIREDLIPALLRQIELDEPKESALSAR